ncbi:MAG: NAD(+) synthase, partial [Dissulfuribacterales bacterium]
EYIVSWLKAYCDNAGMNGFIVGVSGGIDSAVTSTLCAKTGKPVMVLNLPIYQAVKQISLAQLHMKWLEKHFPTIQSINIDLTQAFSSLKRIFPSDIGDELTMANTRARLRMLTLYAFSGHHGLLVAGTGNKVEDFGVGFFTKYGDGGVDLSPIADLVKSEVYEIGWELGIIEGILNAKPTDGLWEDDRSDEDQIGASYDELEWAMGFDEQAEDESRLEQRQKDVLLIYRKFHQANRHKMDPIPVAIIPDALL